MAGWPIASTRRGQRSGRHGTHSAGINNIARLTFLSQSCPCSACLQAWSPLSPGRPSQATLGLFDSAVDNNRIAGAVARPDRRGGGATAGMSGSPFRARRSRNNAILTQQRRCTYRQLRPTGERKRAEHVRSARVFAECHIKNFGLARSMLAVMCHYCNYRHY